MMDILWMSHVHRATEMGGQATQASLPVGLAAG